MPETPRLALPLIAAGQAQKDVTHNEGILALERLVALVAASRTLATPPASPQSGQCHIVPAAAAAWGHPAGTLLHWQGNGWLAEFPRDGQIALVADEGLMLVYRGGWQPLWPVSGLSIGGRAVLSAAPAVVAAPAGGITVDAEARAALAGLITALRQQGVVA